MPPGPSPASSVTTTEPHPALTGNAASGPRFRYCAQHECGNANTAKHGIDLEVAQPRGTIDPGLLEIPARTIDAPRFLVIGKNAARHGSAVIAYREGRAWLISVRCARKEESTLQENEILRFRQGTAANDETHQVGMGFAGWMSRALEQRSRLGVCRQAPIKLWITE